MPYYNTTKITNPVLSQRKLIAESQEEKVKAIFRNKLNGGYTAVEVMHMFPEKRVPLTSIRRAMSNLADEGFLIKTEFTREGMFGRENFIYRLNTGQMTLF